MDPVAIEELTVRYGRRAVHCLLGEQRPDAGRIRLGTELFLRGDGGLVRIDPRTGRTRVVLHEKGP
jgi:hypothetical protein